MMTTFNLRYRQYQCIRLLCIPTNKKIIIIFCSGIISIIIIKYKISGTRSIKDILRMANYYWMNLLLQTFYQHFCHNILSKALKSFELWQKTFWKMLPWRISHLEYRMKRTITTTIFGQKLKTSCTNNFVRQKPNTMS